MRIFNKSIVLIFSLLILSCSKEDFPPQGIQVQDFIWKGLNAYYLWQGDVPDLSDRRFSSDQQLYSYLEGFPNPAHFFDAHLYQKGQVDKFSWIVDDYIALEKSFQGIRKTSGIRATSVNYQDGTNRIFIYVRYVAKGSDAEAKGIQRGMIFSEANGQQLTNANVNQLLGNDSFSLTLANYNGGNPASTATVFNLTKTELEENPVKIASVINEGSKKIGYLMYNQFSTPFDDELNAEFAKFKSENIDDLIIDLRYNGGGSVRSAIYLASMITGQFNGELFSKQVWNDKVQSSRDVSSFINNFTNQIDNGVVTQNINSLNLSTVYFIVSDRTASASELVINGLAPYISVKLVGETTVGKQVGSITLYDSDDFRRNGPNFNTSHTWAMQPIVLEIQNKKGENKPDGFTPEVPLEEDPGNLGVLGDVNEPLLQRTIQYITTGSRGSLQKTNSFDINSKWNTEMSSPDYNNMYVNFK
ncbi:hypothetical protein WH52_02330 [Tenacibaculum holothuriorum]|uniref:Tail specific protease domain-containing protein n=1 Tax=Tenacibaculum holothuriorum TaxID=1635173 RepID=A0A1Y2PHL0_9FLAO|nr:S41 family peptidase [Tenacibaculum holothuriorum]OSY89491.1 hypothetical protein WH52_02330 [Tenacibaculum holothuriorum]